ncbi:MAG: PA2169 family four-helix-bundle protein [Planctomycetota bacterium]
METTHKLNDSTVNGLQKLCKFCHDSAEGYRTAAGELASSTLVEAFGNIADSRAAMRDELVGMLGMSHEDIPDSGTMLGNVHRWWTEARSAISSTDDQAVVAEAIRGENTIEDEYKDVLKDTAGSPATNVLHSHLGSIKACRETLESIVEAQR